MKTLLTSLLLLALLGCRPKDEFQENLIGTWRLVELCKPVGPNCTQTRVPADKGVFVTFSTRNEVLEWYENQDKRLVEYAFFGGSGNYRVEGRKVRVFLPFMSTPNGRLVEVVSLTPQKLVMNPYGTGEYVFEKQ